ncbi:MAG: SRPBCC family protein [Pseudomonadota bacterium]|nr:SRPBCC family protein [Pseudomonadota bacterium]
MITRLLFARLLFALLLYGALPALARAPAPEVSVRRVDADAGRVYEVSARGQVAAAPAQVWRILTDYARMAEFVPDLRSARVLSRSGGQIVVEQFGEAHFLFFRRSIHLVVQVNEQPFSQIDVSLLDGDMKVYRCTWLLVALPQSEGGGTRVLYSGVLAPKFYVPGMLGANMIRADIEKMMAAVLARLERPG